MIISSNRRIVLRLDPMIILLWIFAIITAVGRVFSLSILGIPVFSVFFLLLSAVLVAYFTSQYQRHTRQFQNRWLFVLLIGVSIMTSVLNGWDIFSSIYNAFIYGTPFLLVALPSYHKIQLRTCFQFVRVMVIIGAIISIGVYMGWIDTGIANKNIVALNIVVLDNSIGLIGLIASMYQLLEHESNYNKCVSAAYLILSYMIIIMGQSRARVLLALGISIIFVLYQLLRKQKVSGKTIFFFIGFAVATLILVNQYYDRVMSYMSFSLGKLNTMMRDESSIYRIEEMKFHLNLLKEHPIAGIGCGVLNQKYHWTFDDYYYAHCMLTSFLAMNGLFLGTVMLVSLAEVLFKSIHAFIKSRSLMSIMALVLAGTIIFLSVTSAGFSKYSTHFMMLLLGCCLVDLKT